MADFHFLRPWWLAALPFGLWLIWLLLRGRAGAGGWRGVVDAPLRRFVLADPEVLRESLWPLVAASPRGLSRSSRSRAPHGNGCRCRRSAPTRRWSLR